MHTLAKENTWRTVKLRNYDSLRTIDDESTSRCHVRDSSQINVLDYSIKILMLRICTVKFQFCLQWNAVSKTSIKALVHRIARWINEIVYKLQNKIVTGIRNRENLLKNLKQTFVSTVFCCCVKLKKVFERLQLHF